MPSDTSTDDIQRLEVCPKCGDSFNHWIDNGFKNTWPKGVDFEVCTTDDSERMFVHTQNLHKNHPRDTDTDREGDDA
jgi:hypothetical protein